ncbi:hypothetical protein BU17DRAFT_94835 [Hysterangium stoloniferum]|nr:hypothetical protein BU17DRAFT_94835 [Hysterangium stoloniferum]
MDIQKLAQSTKIAVYFINLAMLENFLDNKLLFHELAVPVMPFLDAGRLPAHAFRDPETSATSRANTQCQKSDHSLGCRERRTPSKDENIKQLLIEYHRRGITNHKILSKLLLAEHGIQMSEATIARHCRQLGLQGSSATTKSLPNTVKWQLILDQMAQDLTSWQGPRAVKEAITAGTGVNLTWETFSPDLCVDGLPAHHFLKSMHNTTIEHGWLQLHLKWGDNVKVHWDAGEDIYNPMDIRHFELVQWLWLKLIQQELNHLQDHFNNHQVQKDKHKVLPSRMSPNMALGTYKDLSAENLMENICLPDSEHLSLSEGWFYCFKAQKGLKDMK